MASSEDRREVAARLRSAAKTESGSPDYLWNRLEIAVNGWRFGDVIDDSYVFYNGVLERLADLIDPTCSVVRKQAYTGGPQMYKTLWCCSECGFPLAESKYKGHRPFVDENFCPRCGARVVSEHEE